AVVIAVHGMNDYAGAFAYAGPYWRDHGVSVYAYDQRGFGRSPDFGRWAGGETMKQDLRAVIAAVSRENPELPIYVVGHSMGAAVILAAMEDAPLNVDGAILAAPGIWGGGAMPIFYRATLNLAAVLAPGKTLTGERAERQASDNIEFLRAMYHDPYVIKETRIDAVLGAVRIMGEGWDATDETGGDILFLYGEKDEIIPVRKMRKAAKRLGGSVAVNAYPESWHLIFADNARERVLEDVLSWIAAQEGLGPQDLTEDQGDTASRDAPGGQGEAAVPEVKCCSDAPGAG
ncbi:MAG: lysophospholipase, partial [Parvularculaceae bacterium]|nr:lysophospholipase [Parvularculaceae bacterium]